MVFDLYLALDSVRLVKQQLDDEVIFVPARQLSTGRSIGGAPFTRSQIYKMLSNPVYAGLIQHQGKTYAGKHHAIIECSLWDKVKAKLAIQRQGDQRGKTARSPSLLAGKVLGPDGQPLIASHACKGARRYRYYISKPAPTDDRSAHSALRIPALELEQTICRALEEHFQNPLSLIERAGLQVSVDQVRRLQSCETKICAKLHARDRLCVRQLIDSISIGDQTIDVKLHAARLASSLGIEPTGAPTNAVPIAIKATLRRSGRAVRLLQDGHAATIQVPQVHLIRLLKRAQSWWGELVADQLTVTELAKRHEVTPSYASRLIRLNFLAPAIVDAIVRGTQPAHLDAKKLLKWSDLPLDWKLQKEMLQQL